MSDATTACRGFQRLYPLLEVLSQSMFCNVIHLTNLSGNRPLSTVFLALIHHEKLVEVWHCGSPSTLAADALLVDVLPVLILSDLCRTTLVQLLQLNRPKLVRFIVAIEDQYMDNPFHNRVLAAFAVHRTYSIMRRLNLGQTSDARIYMLTAMIAAAIAKVGYAGRDNSFLQRAEDPVARQFNDHSPNENNALRISLELMRQPDTNIFEFSEMDHPSKRRMVSPPRWSPSPARSRAAGT